MRVVTKKSLEELAKVMPVIHEEEARAIIGGTIYYDVSGNRLGTVGSSDEIRVVAKDEWEDYNNQIGFNTEKDYNKMGMSLSAASDGIKAFIASSYARKLGFKGAQVNSKMDLQADACLVPGDPDVVAIRHDSMILDHENDLINTLKHEQYHHITGHVGNVASQEIAAIEYQISQPEYSSTTDGYKIKTADYLYLQWQQLGLAGKPGYYKIDAYRKCNVVLRVF